MHEFADSFNANSNDLKLEILRALITQACGKAGQIAEEADHCFTINNLDKAERNQLRELLQNIPHLKPAIKVLKDPENWSRYVIRISKKAYLENLPRDHLHTSIDLLDADRATPRIEELDHLTGRSWSQAHPQLYATDVVRLYPVSEEPAPREVQVLEMAHQLKGDSIRARGEAKDWLGYIEAREGQSNPHYTVVPAEWVTRQNVGDMSSRLYTKEEERERVKKAFSLEKS